jgi:hypothetical protein
VIFPTTFRRSIIASPVSTLENLFRYAKASKVAARENFTTEALAGAIRAAPGPFVALLQQANLVGRGPVDINHVQTQMPVPGTGYIDLVITGDRAGERFELWGEVKVEAGESGVQIDAYRRHIAEQCPEVRLFTIGPTPIRDDPSLPFVSWHQLRKRLVASESHWAWQEFADYLREIRMSDDFDDPIAADEAASFDLFARFMKKLARILVLVRAEALHRGYPPMNWPTEADIGQELVYRFADRGWLLTTVAAPKKKTAWVAMGAVPDTTNPKLVVWVQTWPAQTDLQRELIDLADDQAISNRWQRVPGRWGGLRAESALEPLEQRATVDWYLARLDELHAAGVLDRLAAADPLPPEDPTLSTHNEALST